MTGKITASVPVSYTHLDVYKRQDEQYAQAMEELEKAGEALCQK